jgi:hypothetical protein
LSTLRSKGIQESSKFLDRWRGRFHPNHFYLTEVRLAIAERLGQETHQGIQRLSQDNLQYKISLINSLLELLQAIAPGNYALIK